MVDLDMSFLQYSFRLFVFSSMILVGFGIILRSFLSPRDKYPTEGSMLRHFVAREEMKGSCSPDWCLRKFLASVASSLIFTYSSDL